MRLFSLPNEVSIAQTDIEKEPGQGSPVTALKVMVEAEIGSELIGYINSVHTMIISINGDRNRQLFLPFVAKDR